MSCSVEPSKGNMKQILIAFGLLWAGIWYLFGIFLFIWYSSTFKHIRSLPADDSLTQIWTKYVAWESNVFVYIHALSFALLTVIIGLVAPALKFSESCRKILILMLIIGVVTSNLCHLAGYIPAMVVGEVLFFGVIMTCLIQFLRQTTK
jgi:hypothetical protein